MFEEIRAAPFNQHYIIDDGVRYAYVYSSPPLLEEDKFPYLSTFLNHYQNQKNICKNMSRFASFLVNHYGEKYYLDKYISSYNFKSIAKKLSIDEIWLKTLTINRFTKIIKEKTK